MNQATRCNAGTLVQDDGGNLDFAVPYLWDFWSRYPSMRRVVWFT